MSPLEKQVRKVVSKTSLLPHEMPYNERLTHLFGVGRLGLSLAKLAEAHWDALAILDEAGKKAKPNILYAVWASEIPGKSLKIEQEKGGFSISGTKMFCSGTGIVDRALVAAEGWLIDLDLSNPEQLEFINDFWITSAFKETNTSTLNFKKLYFKEEEIIGKENWYLQRKGFWKGALGPAACWGGGAAGLVDYALMNKRKDSHTLAHLAAMESNIWGIEALLNASGQEMQNEPINSSQYQKLALRVRHLVEQCCTDVLRRFARAYGPFPIACDADIYQRYLELDLFLRQNHGERDLESLGALLQEREG